IDRLRDLLLVFTFDEFDLDFRILRQGYHHKSRTNRLGDKHELLVEGTRLDQEAFHHVLFAFTIDVNRRDYTLRMELRYMNDTLGLIAVVNIVVGELVRAVSHKSDEHIVAIELAQVLTALVAIKSSGMRIIPQIKLV